jgi:hypothetical protein
MPIQQGMNQQTPTAQRIIATVLGSRVRRAARRVKRTSKTSGSRKRRSSGRKIKFGSPAWRKKYKLGKKKR